MSTNKLIAVAAVAASAMTAQGRSLLYYYDFDKVENGALVYTGVNKGTGTLEPTFKQSGSNPLGFVSGGAFGSDHAFSETSSSSLWLGDGSASLGCNTDRGFTISFWVKANSSHNAWSDFFGFRLNGVDYRMEYIANNNNNVAFYYYPAKTSATNPAVRIDGSGTIITELTSGEWRHVAIVAKPNGKNSIGTGAFYVSGEKIANLNFFRGGNLQQLHIGSCVRQQLYDDKDRAGNTGGTCLDELALFDYPATDEQVKWLAKFKPAQPAAGPGREMPYCWHFDTTNKTFGATAKVNSGTGTQVAFLWGDEQNGANTTGYITAPTANAALGTAYAMNAGNRATWRINAGSGLGPTVGSGFTFSFWMRGNAKPTAWTDCFTFGLSCGQYMRYEFNSSSPTAGVNIYGGSNTGPHTRKNDTWQHYCAVWNDAEQMIDYYQDGEFKWRSSYGVAPDPAHVVTTMMAGRQSHENTGAWRLQGNKGNINPYVFVDEVAMFNHSLSPAQIQWLTNNVPCLPPLDATNIVRTVSANGVWAGGRASWTVRKWDNANEEWTDTTRTTIYPALEDTEVEVAVTLADGVELTNDTFITPKRLALSAATSAALPVSATLKTTADSRFAPEALEIGDGLQLTVPLYAASVGGTLTFGTDSKITFDVSNYDGIGEVALTVGGIALPSGETDALTHFAVTDNRFELSLSADGKTVYAKLNNVAATATWTGSGDGTSLGSAANWECRNGSGTVLPDALPCELTRVIVCSGSTALNAPAGTTIPWPFLRIEAGNATLAADSVDLCGIPVLCVPEGVTVNLNGKELHLNGQLEGTGTFTSSLAGGELHVDVPEVTSTTNATVLFTGSLKLVKDGDGTFVAACAKQAYTGGTVVTNGTLKLGTNNLPLGAKNASVKVCAGAIYDMNGYYSTSSCIYAYDLAGTIRSKTSVSGGGYNTAIRILGGTFVVSGDDARLELSNVYFACPDTTPAMFTMNGHTLTFDGTSYVGLGAIRSNDYGKWVFSGGNCIYEWLNGYGPTNVDVEVHAPAVFKLKGNADVKGLVYESSTWQKNAIVSHLLVYGRYVAGPCHLPIQMRNGSTLDLSKITGSFDLTNTVANTASACSGVIGDMTFQSGTAETPSIINVNLAGKTDLTAIRRSESPYVVTWPSQPANVEFVLDAQSLADGYRIYSEAGGLRLKRFMGVMILVR